MIKYYAHSENKLNERHSLAVHLQRTAELAEGFAFWDGYKPLFRITGLLHDFGKYQPAFQNYLINGGRRGSVMPHGARAMQEF